MLRAGLPARDPGQLYPSSLATIAFAVSLRAARPPDTPIPTISRCFSIVSLRRECKNGPPVPAWKFDSGRREIWA